MWCMDINENKEDNSFAKKLFIVHKLEHQIHGPASTRDNMHIVYTCKRLRGTEVFEDCKQQCKQNDLRFGLPEHLTQQQIVLHWLQTN